MARDPAHIVNWQRLDARTTTSGRLAAEDVALLAEIGVGHVINLALEDSPGALADEAELMARAGLRYTHIPVPFDAPGDSHYHAFRAAYLAETEPVHVHCIMNFRVSAFFYRFNLASGMPEVQARALMEKQWSPDTSNHKDMQVWAQFIARGEH